MGGVIAFARPVDVRAWEYDLERGDATFLTHVISTGTGGTPMYPAALPAEIVALARIRGQSVEIVNSRQAWQRDDEIALMTRLTPEEARAALGTVATSETQPQTPA